MKNNYEGLGSSLDDLLKEEGLLKEAKDIAIKRVIEYQKKNVLIRKIIKKHTEDIEKQLLLIGINSINEFLEKKDELIKSNFHKIDDILSIYITIKKLKSVLPEFNCSVMKEELIDDLIKNYSRRDNLSTEDILNELLRGQKQKINYVSKTIQSFGVTNKEILNSNISNKLKIKTIKLYLADFEKNIKQSKLVNNELTFFLNILYKKHKYYLDQIK